MNQISEQTSLQYVNYIDNKPIGRIKYVTCSPSHDNSDTFHCHYMLHMGLPISKLRMIYRNISCSHYISDTCHYRCNEPSRLQTTFCIHVKMKKNFHHPRKNKNPYSLKKNLRHWLPFRLWRSLG